MSLANRLTLWLLLVPEVEEKIHTKTNVDGGYHTKTKRVCDVVKAIDSGCEVDSDPSRINDNDSDNNIDGDRDNDSESSSICPDDRDSDSNYDFDSRPKETRSFLYRHFTITVVGNGSPKKPNLVLLKTTPLHTKGEDNNPRM